MGNVRISVVIIAKNEPFIEYVLKALQLQSLKPYEVLVVVDNPEDISAKIATKYKDTLPIRVVINNIGRGYGAARRKGVEESRGDVIVFLDADVIPQPRLLELFARDLEIHPIVSGFLVNVEEERVKDIVENLTQIPNKVDYLHQCNQYQYLDFTSTANLAFKKDLIDIAGNFDERFDLCCEDSEFMLRLRKLGIKILRDCQAYAYHVRRREKNSLRHRLAASFNSGRMYARAFLKHGILVLGDIFGWLAEGFTLTYIIPLSALLGYTTLTIILLLVVLCYRLFKALSATFKRGVPLLNSLKSYLQPQHVMLFSTGFLLEFVLKGLTLLSKAFKSIPLFG